ncbi:MAG TPA: hypothetical protein VF875_00125 [Anaeromyxobacter sp.]
MFPRLHWGAVIAGVLLALAAHVVLGLIGAALGFAAGPSDSRTVGAAAAIWALVTPFVATLLGAWLACRMAEAEYDSRAAGLHGVLVWCIGLVAGALFLTGTMATGALSAGAAASGNLGAAQRQLRADTSAARAPGAQARGSDEAAKAAAAGAGGGALAAIAGLLGGICGAAISSRRQGARRGRGFGVGTWRFERHEETTAGDRGRAATYPGTTGMPSHGAGTSPGLGESELPPPHDPYHH